MADEKIPKPAELLARKIAAATPTSIDDIIRKHRDAASISMAMDETIMGPHTHIELRDRFKTMEQWRFIRLTIYGRSEVNLLGLNERGILRITSKVRKVDLDNG